MQNKQIICLGLEDLGKVFTLGKVKFVAHPKCYMTAQVIMKLNQTQKVMVDLNSAVFDGGEFMFRPAGEYTICDNDLSNKDRFTSYGYLWDYPSHKIVPDVYLSDRLCNVLAAYATIKFYQRIGIKGIQKVQQPQSNYYETTISEEYDIVSYLVDHNDEILGNYDKSIIGSDINYPTDEDLIDYEIELSGETVETDEQYLDFMKRRYEKGLERLHEKWDDQ